MWGKLDEKEGAREKEGEIMKKERPCRQGMGSEAQRRVALERKEEPLPVHCCAHTVRGAWELVCTGLCSS